MFAVSVGMDYQLPVRRWSDNTMTTKQTKEENNYSEGVQGGCLSNKQVK